MYGLSVFATQTFFGASWKCLKIHLSSVENPLGEVGAGSKWNSSISILLFPVTLYLNSSHTADSNHPRKTFQPLRRSEENLSHNVVPIHKLFKCFKSIFAYKCLANEVKCKQWRHQRIAKRILCTGSIEVWS